MKGHLDRRQLGVDCGPSRSRNEGILFENGAILLCTRQKRRIRKRNSSCVVGLATAALFATFTWSSNRTHQLHAVACSPAAVPPLRTKQGPKLVVPPLRTCVLTIRGGEDKNKRADLDDEAEDTTAGTPDPSREPKASWLSPLGSLLDLSHSVKVDASQENMDEEKQEIGRGGALVKMKAPAPTRSWLVSSFVSPFLRTRTSPVDNDENIIFGENDAENDLFESNRFTAAKSRIASSAIAGAKSVKRVWWVNSWAEQLPSDEDKEVLVLEWEKESNTTSVIADVLSLSNSSDALQGWNSATDKAEDIQDRVENSGELELTNPALDSRTMNDTKPAAHAIKITSFDETSPEARAMHGKMKGKASREKSMTYEDNGDSVAVAEMVVPDVPMPSITPKTASQYVSSGYWRAIDKALSLGAAEYLPLLRVSPKLRYVRKAAAHLTGLHGVLSGKPNLVVEKADEEKMGAVRRRLAAIELARQNVEKAAIVENQAMKKRHFWQRKGPDYVDQLNVIVERASQERLKEERRKERVRAIDKQMQQAQDLLGRLACEKDVLQRRLNPLWNYTTGEAPKIEKNISETDDSFFSSRSFIFPPSDLVDEYLDMLLASGRLARMNHTDLWRNDIENDVDDEDELLSPIPPIHQQEMEKPRRSDSGSTGSWLLRNGFGEKIGVAVEIAAYKAICQAVMSLLARAISGIHGVNVMSSSDIRLSMEQAPDLPPIAAGMIPGSGRNRNYAQDAIQDAMRRGARRHRSKKRRIDDNFVQRDAVVETLASQCLIACPLLNLFPIAWQRAIIGNCVMMATAVVHDFCEGVEFQILGHRLSLAFRPISEEDMIRGMFMDSHNNRPPTNPEEFEVAVKVTAEEVAGNLKFLDRWHERALGSGMVRDQIANLIARLVLSIVDDILGGSRMDLWALHAGGPRLRACLEYRTTANYMEDTSSVELT